MDNLVGKTVDQFDDGSNILTPSVVCDWLFHRN